MFNAMMLNDPGQVEWYMNTGATLHLHSNSCILKSVSNKISNSSSFVLVGDESLIPVTTISHTTLPLPNTYSTLTFQNVLITPSIIKNLIYVHSFVRKNDCFIEFDSFGFYVMDFCTKQILIRFDSTGDLYPVTSSNSQAFVSIAPSVWHQRLGHPGQHVMKHLVQNHFISCSPNKVSTLCHAYQLVNKSKYHLVLLVLFLSFRLN